MKVVVELVTINAKVNCAVLLSELYKFSKVQQLH
jgi:hypothetical protein